MTTLDPVYKLTVPPAMPSLHSRDCRTGYERKKSESVPFPLTFYTVELSGDQEA